MPVLAVKTTWYTLACQLARRPTEELKNVNGLCRVQRCQFRKISKLHPTIGQVCDDLRAPLDVVRRIAQAPGAAAQWERARQLLADLVDRRTRQGRAGRYESEMLEALKAALVGEPSEGPEYSQPDGQSDGAGALGTAEASAVDEQREELAGVLGSLLEEQRGELAEDLARALTGTP